MIAVVVLTYRAPGAMLARCVDSVLAAGDADLVVVVDNGGAVRRDDLPAAVTLVPTEANLGYAGGMNVGLTVALRAGAAAVALLNDDTTVTPGWLRRLAGQLGAPRVGAVQPKLRLGTPDDDPPRIQSAGIRVRADGAGIDIGYGEVDTGQYDEAGPIELFTGGAVMLSREFLVDVGGFDARYFMYYEDIDLARRGWLGGWTYRFEPAAIVYHAMSSTASEVPARRRYWQERNRLWCLLRHGSPSNVGRGLVLSLARLARHPVAAQARAIVDGLGGAPRLLRERRRRVVTVAPLPGPIVHTAMVHQ